MWIARMDMHHGCPGSIRAMDRFRDFLGGLRDDLIRLFALDTSVAGHTDDEWRHSLPHSFHELFAIGVVKPSRLRRRLCVFLYPHKTPFFRSGVLVIQRSLRGDPASVSAGTLNIRPKGSIARLRGG